MTHSLVLLAAGLGTRFSGNPPKATAPVGPNRESLLELSLTQAAAAGFEDVVIVVGRQSEGPITETLAGFAATRPYSVRLVRQDDVGPPRAKPWGTVAALLAADVTACVVANGDDLYGASAFRAAAAWIGGAGSGRAPADAAMVAYRLGLTLLPSGGVSRAVADVHGPSGAGSPGSPPSASGASGASGAETREGLTLAGLTEHYDVRWKGELIVSRKAAALARDSFVSMNLWAFRPSAMLAIREAFAEFVTEHAGDPDAECALPTVVGALVEAATISVDVLPTDSRWLGVTWPNDVAVVRNMLRGTPRDWTGGTAPRGAPPVRPDRAQTLHSGGIGHAPAENAIRDSADELGAVAAGFGIAAPVLTAERLAGGHIHRTWALTAEAGSRYVAQRINTAVFTDLRACEENLSRIDSLIGGTLIPRLLRTAAGTVHWIDPSGHAWRIAEYAEGTVGATAATAEQAHSAAMAFGRFAVALRELPPLRVTIPRFHDLPARMASLSDAFNEDVEGRAATCRVEMARISDVARRVALPSGIMVCNVHNDAKVANVRFGIHSGWAEKLVDLDTAMPGSLLFDLGELVRTGLTSAEEDAADPEIDHSRLAPIVDGYTDAASVLFTDADRAGVAIAGPLMAIENAARFLSDHLSGDRYFAVHYEGQNLARARCQTVIAESLLAMC